MPDLTGVSANGIGIAFTGVFSAGVAWSHLRSLFYFVSFGDPPVSNMVNFITVVLGDLLLAEVKPFSDFEASSRDMLFLFWTEEKLALLGDCKSASPAIYFIFWVLS